MLRLTDNVRTAHTADGTVILDLKCGRMCTLNPTASQVVGLLGRGTEEKDIAHLLALECSIEFRTAEKDVFEFLELLRQLGLIESCPEVSVKKEV